MKTIYTIRDEYLKENDLSVSELTFADAGEMITEWLKYNPMPEFTSHDDYKFAVEKAMWMLRHDEAATYFNGEEYPLKVSEYRWNIEQTILNRDKSQTMAQAAFQYVEKLTINLPG